MKKLFLLIARFFGKKQEKPQFKVVAVAGEIREDYLCDTLEEGEIFIHVRAREMKRLVPHETNIVITMFDLALKRRSNVLMQYERFEGHEKFVNYVPCAL